MTGAEPQAGDWLEHGHVVTDHDLRGFDQCPYCSCGGGQDEADDVTLVEQSAMPLDAGRLREEVFRDLETSAAGSVVLRPRFYERVRALSRLCGVSFETILADVRAELEGIAS